MKEKRSMNRSNSYELLKKVAHYVSWFFLGVIFVYACNYVIDARIRSTRVSDCQWDAVPNPDNASYAARWCKLAKDTVLLRLYDPKEQHLLAERSFFQMDHPDFYWRADAFGYDTRPDGGLIWLPPSLIDRLRARLP